MARFIYEAKKGLNEAIEGIIDAENQEVALKKLADQGLFPTKIRPYSTLIEQQTSQHKFQKLFLMGYGKRITSKDILIFTRKLTTLIRAKLELLAGLKILYEQTENTRLREIILKIYNSTKEGAAFSESLEQFPGVFSPLFVNIIKSGEASGRLDSALTQIGEFLQRENSIRTKVAVALAYPTLLLFVGIASIFVLLNFVIPKLRTIFVDLGSRLPLITRITFGISSFLKDNSLGILLILSLLIASSLWPKGNVFLKQIIKKLKSNIPVIKRVVKNQELIHFCRSLNLLLRSGVPALKSLQIVLPTAQDPIFRKQLNKVCESVAAGESLSGSLKTHTALPDFFTKMITVGEESGRLEEVLDEILYSYTQEVESDIAVISSLLEPVLILFLGIILGAIVLSILLPIFEITQIVH